MSQAFSCDKCDKLYKPYTYRITPKFRIQGVWTEFRIEIVPMFQGVGAPDLCLNCRNTTILSVL